MWQNTREDHHKRGKIYFTLAHGFRGFILVTWTHPCGLVLRQSIVVVETKLLTSGSQEAEKKGLGTRYTLQGLACPDLLTPSSTTFW
jgi:hypothetical protein